MTKVNDQITAQQDSNPLAASVRLKGRSLARAYGQRRHDLRIGRQPNYVDTERTLLNRAIVEPRPLPKIRDENEMLRQKSGAKRAMKANASVVHAGIITFGHEAAEFFGALPVPAQDSAFLDLAEAIAQRLGTRVEALVSHADETQIHAHFELRSYADDGQPISKIMTRQVMSELQDITCEIMQRYCPEIDRGAKKVDRLAAGANYADTLNRSVRQLHEDLPREIAAKEEAIKALDTDIAERQESIEKDKGRVAKLLEKEERSAKEEKRLMVYAARISKKEAALEKAKADHEHKLIALRNREAAVSQHESDAVAQAEEAAADMAYATKIKRQADAEMAQAAAAKQEVEASVAAIEAVLLEMTNETLHETVDGVVFQDPEPVLNAPPKVLKRLDRIIDRYLDIQADWAKRFSWLEGMTNKVKMWLQRDDLPKDDRASGAKVSNDFDQGPML